MSLAGGHLWLVLAIVYHGCENERSSVMNEQLLTTLSGIVVLGIGAQWLAWRLRIPSILLPGCHPGKTPEPRDGRRRAGAEAGPGGRVLD